MRWLISIVLLLLVAGCMNEGPAFSTSAGDFEVATATLGFPPAATPHHAALTDDSFVAADGAALPLRIWLPRDRPAAVVLALHGFNDYANAFSAVGPALAASGVATYAYDQRGFGAAPLRGFWPGRRLLANDALTAVRLLHRRYAGIPIYLLGESMGGAIAILASTQATAHADLSGIILVAPAVWGRQTMNVAERVGLWLADLVPGMRWSADALPMRVYASDNLPMLHALGRDPLVIKETRSDTVNGLVDLMGAALATAPRVTLPALILYGQRDEIVPRRPIRQFISHLPAEDRNSRRFAYYPRGYHLLTRDLDGPMVVADIAAWIHDAAAPLPSGADREAVSRLFKQPSLQTFATAAR